MNIAVIGSGVVGVATGKAFSLDHKVIFCDTNQDILRKLQAKGFNVADNTSMLTKISDVIFICVNTPTNDDGTQNLTALTSVLDEVAKGLNSALGRDDKMIIVRSTILPETSKWIIDYLTKIVDKQNYEYFYNPEFLTADNALYSTLFTDRIVIGGHKNSNWKKIDELYSWWKCPIVRTEWTEAEMIKYTSNCFLATKISFFNDIGRISRSLGLDVKVIEYAVSLDKRIGRYGTESGRAFAGACLPKDILAFQTKFKSQLLGKVLEVNDG